MKNWTIPPAVLLAVALVAGACSPFGPIPDRSRYYTLAAPETAGHDATRSDASGLTYGLGPITLPAYLDRNQIATRLSPTEVAYSQWDRWAEPLGANIASVLRQSLVAALGNDEIVTYPWTPGTGVDYQIEVRLLSFESDTQGQATLIARWSVRDMRNDRRSARKETTLTRAVRADDRAATTTALSGMLGDLAQEIAGALRALPPAATSTPATRAVPRRK